MSKSSRDQMSKSHQGLTHSQKTKDKIGKSGLGRVAWNKGKSMSKSSRDQMSKSHQGLKPSDKTREKMSKTRKEMLTLKKIKEG
jgi:hypothetical protein